MKTLNVAELKKRYGKNLSALLKETQDLRKTHSRMVCEVDSVSIGMALRKMREDADIGLNDMARRIGLSAPFVSDCELGRRNLSLSHTIAFLAEVKKG